MTTQPVTLLFTDLVNSTALLERVGDERAQRVLRVHRQLLREALASHGGAETKWLGDGLLATFASVAEAVRCAVTMQQGARGRTNGRAPRPAHRAARRGDGGGRGGLRGQPGGAGAAAVRARGRGADPLRQRRGGAACAGARRSSSRRVGALELKGFAEPLPAYEVVYTPDDAGALRRQAPFTGRTAELARLGQRLEEARAGRGGRGAAGGRAGDREDAHAGGAGGAGTDGGRAGAVGALLRGRGGAAVGAVRGGARGIRRARRRRRRCAASSGRRRRRSASSCRRCERGCRSCRSRWHSSRTRSACACSTPSPRSCSPWPRACRRCWCSTICTGRTRDGGAAAPRGAVRAARAAPGAGRVSRRRGGPRSIRWSRCSGRCRGRRSYDQLALAGLDPAAVRTLLGSLTDADVPEAWATILTRETSGNPFFLREVLLHLAEEGALGRAGGAWRTVADLDGTGVPETVRQVIERRLGRLSAPARRAAQGGGGVHGRVASRSRGGWRGWRRRRRWTRSTRCWRRSCSSSTADPHAYDFTHALVRHTLYGALSPAAPGAAAPADRGGDGGRRMGPTRGALRRGDRATLPPQCRPAREPSAGCRTAWPAAEQAERAVGLRGRRGRAGYRARVVTCRRCAARAAPGPPRPRPGVGAPRASEAAAIAVEAAELVAVSERARRRRRLSGRGRRLALSLDAEAAWDVAQHGLTFTEGRRDWTWAVLRGHDLDRMDAEDADHPGIVLDTPERREIAAFSPAIDRNDRLTHGPRQRSWMAQWGIFESRPAVLTTAGPMASFGLRAGSRSTPSMGDSRRRVSRCAAARERDADAASGGRLSRAAWCAALGSFLRASLGDLAAAEQELLGRRAGRDPRGTHPAVAAAWQLAMGETGMLLSR